MSFNYIQNSIFFHPLLHPLGLEDTQAHTHTLKKKNLCAVFTAIHALICIENVNEEDNECCKGIY